jgi:hypothetical protein
MPTSIINFLIYQNYLLSVTVIQQFTDAPRHPSLVAIPKSLKKPENRGSSAERTQVEFYTTCSACSDHFSLPYIAHRSAVAERNQLVDNTRFSKRARVTELV